MQVIHYLLVSSVLILLFPRLSELRADEEKDQDEERLGQI